MQVTERISLFVDMWDVYPMSKISKGKKSDAKSSSELFMTLRRV